MPKRKPRATEVEKVAAEILQAATGGAAPLTIEGVKNPAAPRVRRPVKRAKKTTKAAAARRQAK